MHVCHAIYQFGFHTYLEPVITALGFNHLHRDFILCKWNRNDEFLLLFAEASFNWLQGLC